MQKTTVVYIHTILFLLIPTTGWSTDQEETHDSATFRIAITRTSELLNLDCIQGCKWRTAPFEYPIAGNVGYVSQTVASHSPDGRSLGKRMKRHVDTFKFTIETKSHELKLRCIRGCAWENLIVDCRDIDCVATVDETGVSLGPQLSEPSDVPDRAKDHRQSWPQCVVQQFALVIKNGGPITFETALDEAQHGCEEYEQEFRTQMAALSTAEENVEDRLQEMFQTAWAKLSERHNPDAK